MNPYAELDVPITATIDEIKLRFKALAQFHHPDKGGDEETFKRIRQSYEILIDPIRRRKFDLTGDYSPDENFNSEALGKLSEFVNELLYKIDADKDNLLDVLNIKIQQSKNENYNNQAQANTYITSLEKIQAKIKVNNEGAENVLYSFIEAQLEVRRGEYRMFTRCIKVLDHMTFILHDYNYVAQHLLTQ